MTEALLQQGYLVAGFDLAGNNLINLQQSYPNQLMYFKTDVTKDLEIRESVEVVIDKWGKVDILVNNACLAIFSPFEQKAIEDTKREFEVNYFGCCQPGGSIVDVCGGYRRWCRRAASLLSGVAGKDEPYDGPGSA